MKKTITESQLRSIIAESIKKALKEDWQDDLYDRQWGEGSDERYNSQKNSFKHLVTCVWQLTTNVNGQAQKTTVNVNTPWYIFMPKALFIKKAKSALMEYIKTHGIQCHFARVIRVYDESGHVVM